MTCSISPRIICSWIIPNDTQTQLRVCVVASCWIVASSDTPPSNPAPGTWTAGGRVPDAARDGLPKNAAELGIPTLTGSHWTVQCGPMMSRAGPPEPSPNPHHVCRGGFAPRHARVQCVVHRAPACTTVPTQGKPRPTSPHRRRCRCPLPAARQVDRKVFRCHFRGAHGAVLPRGGDRGAAGTTEPRALRVCLGSKS